MWTLPYSSVLVPVDLDDTSVQAARLMLKALAHDAELHVVTALEIPVSPGTPMLGPASAQAHARHEAVLMRERAEAARTRLQEELGDDPRMTLHVKPGAAAEIIVDLAAALDVALIALPTHGRTGPRRWIMGSVAERVVRHAPCPVLVLRTP